MNPPEPFSNATLTWILVGVILFAMGVMVSVIKWAIGLLVKRFDNLETAVDNHADAIKEWGRQVGLIQQKQEADRLVIDSHGIGLTKHQKYVEKQIRILRDRSHKFITWLNVLRLILETKFDVKFQEKKWAITRIEDESEFDEDEADPFI